MIEGSSEGWFYGADFQSLSEKNLKAKPSQPVRQRRWIRVVTKTVEPSKPPPARPPKAQSTSTITSSVSATDVSSQRPPAVRRNSSHDSDDGGKPGSRESSVVDPAEAQTQSQSSWFGFGGSSEIAPKYIIKDPALQAIGKQIKYVKVSLLIIALLYHHHCIIPHHCLHLRPLIITLFLF